DLVDLLEHLAAELADRARPADRDDRTAIDQRIGEARAEIEGRRAARRHAHAGPLGHPRIGLRHVGGALLVAGIDQPDALLDAAHLGIEHRPAHDEERILDALRLQAACEDFVTAQFRHLASPPDLLPAARATLVPKTEAAHRGAPLGLLSFSR